MTSRDMASRDTNYVTGHVIKKSGVMISLMDKNCILIVGLIWKIIVENMAKLHIQMLIFELAKEKEKFVLQKGMISKKEYVRKHFRVGNQRHGWKSCTKSDWIFSAVSSSIRHGTKRIDNSASQSPFSNSLH